MVCPEAAHIGRFPAPPALFNTPLPFLGATLDEDVEPVFPPPPPPGAEGAGAGAGATGAGAGAELKTGCFFGAGADGAATGLGVGFGAGVGAGAVGLASNGGGKLLGFAAAPTGKEVGRLGSLIALGGTLTILEDWELVDE